MKRIAFESEYFIAQNSDRMVPAVIPPAYPMDESGILLEVRGKAGDPYKAVGSFLAEYLKIKDKLHADGLHMLHHTRIRLSKQLKLELSRGFVKPLYKAQNLYKDDRTHVKSASYHYAGLHIHFSDNTEYESHTADGQYSKTMIIPKILDIPTIVRKLDGEYKDLITAEFRNIGCYELKGDNFEYRSMPTYWIAELEDVEALLSIAKFAYSLF